ncbi:hypothetical protein BGZ80_008254, partial [Entomortierella chlamydospora]
CDRDFWQVSMRPVMTCRHLEVLRVSVTFSFLGDHTDTLLSLASLRHLEIVVEFPNEIEFLQRDESAIDLPLPSLEAIFIKHLRHSDQTRGLIFSRLYSHILRTRTNLKTFSVEGEDINPVCIFSEPDQMGSNTKWACLNLEHLRLTLSWPKLSINTEEKMRRCWDTVFEQVGKLHHLKTLSIESQDLETYPGLGYLRECHLLSNLEELVLAAPGPMHGWRVSQIELLLMSSPRLRTINLGWLKHNNVRSIKNWLGENLYKRLEFNFVDGSDDEDNDGYDGSEEDEGDEDVGDENVEDEDDGGNE